MTLTQFVLDEGNTEVKVQAELRDMNTIPFVQEIFRRVDQVARVENLSPEDRREYERDLKMVMSMVENGISIDMASQIAGLSQAEVEDMIKTVCD